MASNNYTTQYFVLYLFCLLWFNCSTDCWLHWYSSFHSCPFVSSFAIDYDVENENWLEPEQKQPEQWTMDLDHVKCSRKLHDDNKIEMVSSLAPSFIRQFLASFESIRLSHSYRCFSVIFRFDWNTFALCCVIICCLLLLFFQLTFEQRFDFFEWNWANQNGSFSKLSFAISAHQYYISIENATKDECAWMVGSI